MNQGFISDKQEVREEGGSEEFGAVYKKSWVSSAKVMKRRGPWIQPWGTPAVTEEVWDLKDLSWIF